MRVIVATGIFPPDIGGPATHACDLSRELRARGHDVTVLSLTDGRRTVAEPGLVRYPRGWPWPVRTVAVARWLVRHRRAYDVVYATGLDLPAVAGARLSRRPVVLKVVGDPAWERGRREGLTGVDFDDFQDAGGGSPRLRAMRAVRDWGVRHASAVVVPSSYLQGVVGRWTGGRRPVAVIPNGVRHPGAAGQADAVGQAVGRGDGAGTGGGAGTGLRLLYVGRLVSHKRVEILLEALARTRSCSLEVVGEGPELDLLTERCRALGLEGRVRFSGALGHDEVMRRLATADALVSATSYEGLPHVVIEALVCGTPVLSTRAGGVAEAVIDGVNGRLLDDADPATFATLFEGLAADPLLLRRYRDGARETGRAWTFDQCATEVENLLATLVRGRPWAAFIGKGTVAWPPGDDLRRKLAIHSRHLRQLSIGVGPVGVRGVSGVRALFLPRLRPRAAEAVLFYGAAPLLAVAATAGRRGGVIVCQSPYEGLGAVVARALLPHRLRPLVQIELHGDWRTASRLYGSRLRRPFAPLSDGAATWALRRADRVRVVSLKLADMARAAGFEGPIDRHVTYSEFDVFLAPPPEPLPDHPVAAFVGVLERYKAVDVLLDAWPIVAGRVPGAELALVGAGSLRAEVGRRVDEESIPGVRLIDPMAQAELSQLLDRSTCLVLPSRSEGLPRIVLEAMARGRAVVASEVGGMAELVDGTTGRLVPAEDVLALADALVEVLADRAGAERMGRAARLRAEQRQPVAEYEAGIARLAAWALSGEQGRSPGGLAVSSGPPPGPHPLPGGRPSRLGS